MVKQMYKSNDIHLVTQKYAMECDTDMFFFSCYLNDFKIYNLSKKVYSERDFQMSLEI